MATDSHPALIGLDWGTSFLRGYLLGADGRVLESRSRPWGVQHVPGGDFAAAFADLVGEWRSDTGVPPAIASGMIGSRQGWREAAYVDCPADASRLAAGLVSVATGTGTLHIVPGLTRRGEFPDVMRGEETQIVGALEAEPHLASETVFILPGTHAKWAAVRDGRIERFATAPTGEVFAAIRDHTILGRPALEAGAACGPVPGDAFVRGVRVARDAGCEGILTRLFSVRTLHLVGDLAAADSLDYLSGLLVGEEIRSMAARPEGLLVPAPVLVGDAALCGRYRAALGEFGCTAPRVLAETVTEGLWRIARAAGLVDGSASAPPSRRSRP